MSPSDLPFLAGATTVPFPALSDTGNWNQPPYYTTLHCADVDGDQRAELIARGSAGISIWSLAHHNAWTAWPAGPALNDGSGWNQPQYYTTIRCADVDGDGRVELLARGAAGINTWKFNIANQQWALLTPNALPLNDGSSWNQPQYYTTIQYADIDGDGRAEVVARGGVGIHTYQYQPQSQAWGTLSIGTPALSDVAAWNQPQYYTTIRCADIDGDGRAELLARGAAGIDTWKYDPTTRSWTPYAQNTILFTDASGWNQPQYYTTIRCADVDGDGRAELLARGIEGITLWKFDLASRQWQEVQHGSPQLNDQGNWNQPQYYTTIQYADVDGDGRAELLARGSGGIVVFQCDRTTHTWTQLPGGPALNDASNWYQPQYYSTIQCADLDGDGRAELLARGAAGITAFRCDPATHMWNPIVDMRTATEIHPFTGFWAIRAPNGGYLRADTTQQFLITKFTALNATTSPTVTRQSLFRFIELGPQANGRQRLRLAIPDGSNAFANTIEVENRLLSGLPPLPQATGELTLVDEPAAGYRAFSLLLDDNTWIAQGSSGQFSQTSQMENRAIFTRPIKLADDETQVGALVAGEAALYENENYTGRAWIFSADFANFLDVDDLNDLVSSIQLGPFTGVTLYGDIGFSGARLDVVEPVPALAKTQLGDNILSSLRVWCNLPPADVGITATSGLSQDYQSVNGTMTAFSAYRTILQLPRDVKQVEVWATDTLAITVGATTTSIDEDHSWSLTPNSMHRVMILTPATGVSTPGLKVRTDIMQSFERCVIFPDRTVHERLANLQGDELYNAQRHDNTPLINRATITPDQARAVQETISRTMATLRYSGDTDNRPVQRDVVAVALQASPWALHFGAPVAGIPTAAAANASTPQADFLRAEPVDGVLQQTVASGQAVFGGPTLQHLDPNTISQLFAQADLQGGTLAQGWDFLDDFANSVKQATQVVVGAIKNAVVVVVDVVQQGINWVVDTAKKGVAWVIDTAEKVTEFVKNIVEKIGVAVGDFVAWLQSIFNWDDILATQHYLSDCITQGLTFFRQRVANSKGPVGNFFDQQRDKVHTQLDHIIAELGGGIPEADQTAKPPAELEWILARLGDNAGGASASLPGTPDGLAQDWSHVVSSYGKVATDLIAKVPLLVPIVSILPANPKQAVAGILQIVRDLLDDALNATRDTILLLIDIVEVVIGLFEQIITTEIHIPFITDFYHYITNGQPLTLVSLASLLVAIPVTVISKLRPGGQRAFGTGSALALDVDQTAAHDWGIASSVCGYLTGLIAALTDPIPDANLPSFMWIFEVESLVISFFIWLASFPGGYPHLLSFQADNEGDVWDYVNWGYGTLLYGLDILSLASNPVIKKRFKRVDDVTAAATTVLASIQLVLAISTSARTGGSITAGFANAISTLPGIAAFNRIEEVAVSSSGISLGVLAGIDNIAATATLVLSNVGQ